MIETEPGPDGIDPGDLSISQNEHVLGAVIHTHPRWLYREMHGLRNPSGFTDGVKVEAVDGDPYLDRVSRGYIAAWARRTLFRVDMERVDGDSV